MNDPSSIDLMNQMALGYGDAKNQEPSTPNPLRIVMLLKGLKRNKIITILCGKGET